MANSLLADLLKTPSQVREEQMQKLRAEGLQRAGLLQTPTGARTALPGIYTNIARSGIASAGENVANIARLGSQGLGGLLSAAGAPQAGQALAQATVTPEERQAGMLQETLRKVDPNNLNNLRAVRARLQAQNAPAQAIMFIDQQISAKEKEISSRAAAVREQERQERIDAQQERLTELKIQQAEKQLSGEAPPKIGAINPQDFYPSSIAKFAQSGDFNDLKRIEKDKPDTRPDLDKKMDRYLKLLQDDKDDQALKYGRAAGLVPEVSATLQKDYLESGKLRQEAASNMLKYRALADDVQKNGQDFGGGTEATWEEFYKEVTGSTDAVSELRTRYRNIRATSALQNLPPGAASDTDVRIALSGVPPENANAETVESFLRGLAKLEGYVEEYNRAKLKYIDDNQDIIGFESQWIESQQAKQTPDTQTRTTASGVTYTIID